MTTRLPSPAWSWGTLLAQENQDEEAAPLLAASAGHAQGTRLGRALTSLGLIAQRKGDFATAEQHFRQALAIAEDQENQLTARRNLVILLIDDHRREEAVPLQINRMASDLGFMRSATPPGSTR